MKELTDIREGWVWPKDDVRCWRCFQRQYNLPQSIIRHVENKKVCIQAGGNTGVYVKQFADVFETVYTFEPEAVNFYCLTENLKNCNNVETLNSFLGQQNQKPTNIIRYDTKKDPNTGKFKIGEDAGTIPVIAIDTLNLRSCDLIQLDIEGGEYNALLGAVETIKEFKPVICLEWFENQEKLFNLLTSLNYKEIDNLQSDRIFAYQH
jgi:FkbM family methyltransferase|tara:strand:- start:1097 stop:1717 length:621 start_codon:yes stop_codon:yes gene_type:complete